MVLNFSLKFLQDQHLINAKDGMQLHKKLSSPQHVDVECEHFEESNSNINNGMLFLGNALPYEWLKSNSWVELNSSPEIFFKSGILLKIGKIWQKCQFRLNKNQDR